MSSQSPPHTSPLQQRASAAPSLSASRKPNVVGSQSSSWPGASQTSSLPGARRSSSSSQSSPPHSTLTCPSPSSSSAHGVVHRSSSSSHTVPSAHVTSITQPRGSASVDS